MFSCIFHTLQPRVLLRVWCWLSPATRGPAWQPFNALLSKMVVFLSPVPLEATLKLVWLHWVRTSAGSLYDREPLLSGGRLTGPAADSGDAAGWEDGCLVLPCSRSCWSYHGSSSSVTNSSILPELSMGEHPGESAETSPSVWTIELQRAGSSSRQRSLLQAAHRLSSVRECCVGARRVSSCPSSPLCSFGHSHLSSPHRPAPAHPGAQTRRCCCCCCCRGSYRRGSDVAITLPLSTLSAAHSRCLHVPLVRFKTAVLFPSPRGLGQARPLDSSHANMTWHHSLRPIKCKGASVEGSQILCDTAKKFQTAFKRFITSYISPLILDFFLNYL